MMELTEIEFKNTMSGKMVNITEMADPVVDIWPFVKKLVVKNVVLEYVFKNELVETVYGNIENTFHHVLLPTDNKNIILDLNRKYG